MGRRPIRKMSLPATILVLVLVVACGRREPPWYEGIHDLSDVAISTDLAPALAAGVAALKAPGGDPKVVADFAFYDDVLERMRPVTTRQQAGDELYARWQAEPTNVMWLELAKNYDFLLRRRSELERRCAHPELADPETPLGAYVAGRLYFRHGDRGEHYLRAERDIDRLDAFAQVWLNLKLSEVDSEGGNVLAGVRRLLKWLPRARQLGGPRLEGKYWARIAALLKSADRLDDALQAATLTAACYRRAGSHYNLLASRIALARIIAERREYEAALNALAEIADAAAAHNYVWLERSSLHAAAGLNTELGDYRQALELDRRNLACERVLGDPLNLPRQLASIAHDHRMLGDMDSCYVYLMKAKFLVDAYPDPRNVAGISMRLAEYFCQIGRYATADSLLAAADDQSTRSGTASDEARILLELTPEALETGRVDLAYGWLARLSQLDGSLIDRGPDQNLRADYHLVALRLLARQGEFRRAAAERDRAAEAIARSGGEGKAWQLQAATGELALLREDLATAETAYVKCLELATAGTDPDLLARSRFQLGRVLLARGKADAARNLFQPVDNDTTFGGRFGRRLRSLLLTGESYLAAGDILLARQWFQRGRDACSPHTPADLVARFELGLGRTLAAADSPQEAYEHLQQAHAALARMPGKSSFDEVAAYLSHTEREVQEAFIGLLADHPALAGRDGSSRAALAVAWPTSSLPSPHRGAPWLLFFTGRERSFAWVVDDQQIVLHDLPGAATLRSLLAPVLADLAAPGRSADRQSRQRLSLTLLGPVAIAWQADAVLTVVPDGPLSGVPWSALVWPPTTAGEGLVLDHGPVVEAVNGARSTRKHRNRLPEQMSLLAAGCDSDPESVTGGQGLPRLRRAESEARQVAALWSPGQNTVRLGSAAAWDTLIALGLDRFTVIHVASHARVHQGLPGLSTLRLSAGPDAAPVTVPAVAALDLNAELVYLSCCDAARRLHERNSGVADFAGAFLAAGARTVIASSIWVDDQSSQALATAFYRNWRAGLGKAQALRAARQELRAARTEWRHPAYWAFIHLRGAPD